jgi:DNA-binding NtrC family response regulator
MQLLVDYPWPGNVRELRNLIESMVVLAPNHEIQPGDLPRHIREGGAARLLPVHIGPILRGQEGAAGRELEVILRSLLELKLQVEELRRRVDEDRPPLGSRDGSWIGVGRAAVHAGGGGSGGGGSPGTEAQFQPEDTNGEAIGAGSSGGRMVGAIEPPGQPAPPNVVTIAPGTKMADIERAVIEAALKETRGNRRRAAELLGIGERTLYRKIKEYRMPEHEYSAE